MTVAKRTSPKRRRRSSLDMRPGRRLTPEEYAQAEDAQVLWAAFAYFDEPATSGLISDSMLPYESSPGPTGGSIVISWGDFPVPERRALVRGALGRLRAKGLVRVVGRRWALTFAGYVAAGGAVGAKGAPRPSGIVYDPPTQRRGERWWVAELPGVPGAMSQGRTRRSATDPRRRPRIRRAGG